MTWKINTSSEELDWEEYWGRSIVVGNTHGNGAAVGGQLQVVVIDEFSSDKFPDARDDLMRRIAARIEQVLNEEFA